jgi:hypothetical protein
LPSLSAPSKLSPGLTHSNPGNTDASTPESQMPIATGWAFDCGASVTARAAQMSGFSTRLASISFW